MGTWVSIALGGAFGAVLRHALAVRLAARFGAAHHATLVINVLGCLAIGAVLAWIESRPGLGPALRHFLVIGLLGSFTTYSTFGHETFALIDAGRTSHALAHMGLHLVLGLVAVWVGRGIVLQFAG